MKKPDWNRLIPDIINISFAVVLVFIIFSNLMVSQNSRFIVTEPSDLSGKLGTIKAGIVLGGGVTPDRQPTDVLKGRLDAAAKLYSERTIDRILVSGDNRFVDYNEPQVMQDYLQTNHNIPSLDIQQDNAGRSTYETCERAVKVFGLKEAVMISQNSHLPRAIYLCRSLGLRAYGFPATTENLRASQALREIGANVKAVYNINVRGEDTVLGDPITF